MKVDGPEGKKREIQLKVNISPEVAEGIYSNFVNIMSNPAEFVVDFGRIVPRQTEFKVYSRIFMTPICARQLLSNLKAHIENYEKKHGEIQVNLDSPKKVGF